MISSSILRTCFFVLFLNDLASSVSIRRRKNLFGQQWEPNQIQANDSNIPVVQSSETAVSEPSVSTIQEQAPEQVRRKAGRPQTQKKKPRPRSTDSTKKWFAKTKAEFKKGNRKAIDFFAKRNRKAREKTARIQQGIATPLEQERYNRVRMLQKQWRENNQSKLIAYREKLKAKENRTKH